MKRKRRRWREAFLVNFSDDELEKMFVALSQYQQFRRKRNCHVRAWFQGVPPKVLVGLLYLMIFGKYRRDDGAFRAVMEQVDAIKGRLKSVELPKPEKPPSLPLHLPQMPENFWVEHPEIGRVFVTRHAWKRFYEICYELIRDRRDRDLSHLAGFLTSGLPVLFARSVIISPTEEEISRDLNRGRSPATFFLDSETGLKYIVGRRGRCFLLVTVISP